MEANTRYTDDGLCQTSFTVWTLVVDLCRLDGLLPVHGGNGPIEPHAGKHRQSSQRCLVQYHDEQITREGPRVLQLRELFVLPIGTVDVS